MRVIKPLALALLGLTLASGCGPRWTVRHWEVTLEVTTPAGARTGRGVIETRTRGRNELLYTMDSAPITRTIESTLPWLRQLPTSGASISGQTDHIAPDRIAADRLWRAHFTTFDPGKD